MLVMGDSALRKEADAMTFVGCDLHTRMQQVAVLDTRTGEVSERQLAHDGSAVEEFYAAWPGPVTVGIESTGYATWFHTLIQRLGHTLLVGDAAKIRAMVVRKTKTDRRDALHLLDLLRHDRFPTVWVPDPATRDLRALLAHRMRLVRIRTMVKNGLHAIALTYRPELEECDPDGLDTALDGDVNNAKAGTSLDHADIPTPLDAGYLHLVRVGQLAVDVQRGQEVLARNVIATHGVPVDLAVFNQRVSVSLDQPAEPVPVKGHYREQPVQPDQDSPHDQGADERRRWNNRS